MDRWFLIASTLLAAVAGLRGLLILRHGNMSRWTIFWMIAVIVCQMGYLVVRGEMRGACPLRSIGEISVFLAWSLTLFYLLVGPVYRISLLGVFSGGGDFPRIRVAARALGFESGKGDEHNVLGRNPFRDVGSCVWSTGVGGGGGSDVLGVG
jgi:hypothetical protein